MAEARSMTQADRKKLETILAKVESLQGRTTDAELKARLNAAKSELLIAWKVTP